MMKHLSVLVFLATQLMAGDGLPHELESESIVRFGEGKSEQVFSDLVIAELPELHTRVIYSKRGIIPQKSKGIVYVYPGTSGRCDSEYGIQRSLAPIVNEVRKRGYAVVAFQPPIYFKADAPLERFSFVEKYSHLQANLDWHLKTMEFVEGKLQKAGIDPDSIPHYAIGRSTFAAISLEAIHRLAQGDEEFQPLSRLNRVAIIGLDGHHEDQIAEWHDSEKEFFLVKNPEKGDAPVVMAAPKIFSQMTHQNTFVASALTESKKLPEIVFTLGSRDEFARGRIDELFRPIMDFMKHHPGVNSTLAWHHGHHDPGREVRHETTRERIAGPMANMKLVLDEVFRPQTEAPVAGARKVIYLPDEEAVLEPLHHEVVGACQQRIKALAS